MSPKLQCDRQQEEQEQAEACTGYEQGAATGSSTTETGKAGKQEKRRRGEEKPGRAGQAKFVLQLIDSVILPGLLFDCFQLAADREG